MIFYDEKNWAPNVQDLLILALLIVLLFSAHSIDARRGVWICVRSKNAH